MVLFYNITPFPIAMHMMTLNVLEVYLPEWALTFQAQVSSGTCKSVIFSQPWVRPYWRRPGT